MRSKQNVGVESRPVPAGARVIRPGSTGSHLPADQNSLEPQNRARLLISGRRSCSWFGRFAPRTPGCVVSAYLFPLTCAHSPLEQGGTSWHVRPCLSVTIADAKSGRQKARRCASTFPTLAGARNRPISATPARGRCRATRSPAAGGVRSPRRRRQSELDEGRTRRPSEFPALSSLGRFRVGKAVQRPD